MTIIVPFDKCNLSKATNWGLEFLLDALLCDERYEECCLVRDEINRRNNMGLW